VSHSKRSVVPLCELTPGQFADFFAVLAERGRGATRDGKPYFTCRFRDARRTVGCMIWGDGAHYADCEREWREGSVYKIRGAYLEHDRYGPQIEIQKIRPVNADDRADGFDPGALAECSRFDREAMLAELKALAEEHIADLPLRRLVLTILERHAEPLQRLPATTNKFYPFVGGLLEHTLAVAHSCLHLVEKYAAAYPDLQPPLNKDLVMAGAILHDIGRVREFAAEALAAQPTVPGRLFGHLVLGRDLVHDIAGELGDVNPELVQLLEHLILSHLALPEWGSPRLPLIPEVLIIHHADDLDAKLEMYVRCLSRDAAAGPFTDRDPVLGRHLYKGRTL
jgi:3'-5' exoribonuclease